ncbi:MAG: hypothetical protein AB1297_08355 [bacterium]
MAVARSELENRFDTLQIVEKRTLLLIGAKLRNKERMLKAVKLQDELCKKYQEQADKWDGVKEIRKWRDKRK